MKNRAIILMFTLFGIVFISSCKKKGCKDPISINYDSKADEDDGSCKYGGTGGSTTIAAFPKHHGVSVFSSDSAGYLDTAYVKFNAINLPGTHASDYDLVLPGDSGENHVHIPGLKTGKYFIFMTGWDNSIHKRVFGGIAYTLTQASGEIDLDVPVSEE